jgi:hypothetical protein
MDTKQEQIQWQEEEVAWGSFVPYSVVKASAEQSISRLALKNDWPGASPPIESRSSEDKSTQTFICNEVPNWTDWDFVPDGLLVWEAWLQKMATFHSS